MSLSQANRLSIVIIASLGAMFECYDFMLCVFMAPLLIKLFYAGNAVYGIFAIFSIAFLSRPLGGIFWGHLGDRYGRQKVFSLTMLLLVLPTLLIAFFPLKTSSIWLSSFSFTLLRFLQGFLVGGEFAGGVTFIAEIAKAKYRGLSIASFMAVLTLGTLLASLVSLLVNVYLTTDEILNWGWRLPFFVSVVLIVIAAYIRSRVRETPFFRDLLKHKAVSSLPLVEALHDYSPNIFYGFIISSCSAIGFTNIYTFLPGLMKFNAVFSADEILYATTIGISILSLSMPLFGYLADRYGRKLVFIIGLIISVLLWWLFIIAVEYKSLTMLLLAMLAISFSFAMVNANYCVILSELFPTRVRYSAVALCYTLSFSIFGGILPLVYTHYLILSHSLILPWVSFIIILVLTLLVMPKISDCSRHKLLA